MNVHSLGHVGETGLPNLKTIDAKRQTLHIEGALIAGREHIAILICLTDNLHRCFHAQTGRIGHSKAQFTSIALAKER